MTNLSKLLLTNLSMALIALCLPVMAAAQSTNDPYGVDYGRDGTYRRDNDRYGDNRRRRVSESVKRLDNMSEDFRKHLKRALDDSRFDHRNREDRINDVAKEFRRATERLEDRYDDGRRLDQSSGEARRVLQLGARLDEFMRRNRLDGRVESDWAYIRQDLNVVAHAYGFNMSDFYDRRYSDNRDRDYGRDDNDRRIRNDRHFNWPW